MGAQIAIDGLTRIRERFRRAPSRIREATVAHVQRVEATRLAHDAKSAAGFSRMSRRAASTLRLTPLRDGAQVRAGGGSDLGSVLLMGSEGGGRKRGKVAYVSRSRTGTPYVIRRRTTQQFPPYVGRRGYWYWPTARRDLKGIRKRIRDVAVKAVEHG